MKMFALMKPSAWLGWREGEEEEEEEVESVEEDEEEELLAKREAENQKKILEERRRLKNYNQALRARLHDLEQALQERPPVWVPDSERRACVGCGEEFSWLNRRHHCRCCGEVFDGKCTSRYRELVFYPGAGPQRVCDVCFERPRAPRYDNAELENSALIALGLGVENDFDKSIVLTEPLPERVKFVRKQKVKEQKEAVVKKVVPGGKIRSEIPTPPPLPSLMPSSTPAAPKLFRCALSFHSEKKASKPFVPPKTNLRRLDQAELQEGIARLKKTPRTPVKQIINKNEEPDFRSSLKRRRRALEESVIEQTAQEDTENMNISNLGFHQDIASSYTAKADATPNEGKAISLIDGLKDRVVFKDSPIVPIHGSLNSSWLE